MPNPYFEFKQFTVYHDQCAMKVGTDGVLLGAWTKVDSASTALDIGTGTGLISLMLAQRNGDINIDAIDIDHDAIKQATENMNSSPFNSQIHCYNLSLQDFAKLKSREYDLIVSNPPFFNQSLKSPKQNRTLARHTDSLFIEELIELSSSLLKDKGRLSLIYPHESKDLILSITRTNNLFPSRITEVLPTPTSSPKRILIELSREEFPIETKQLVVELERHKYSPDFIELVKDYYLKL
ncbi:tRNA1(Val) (adenine(37)-N6)-methyltransferase [Dysgonomonas sp. Marseille-P4361]|uniref:tRNA1(Val) (adenine(37)-N6)-methyltransferase n=1 Tax=Dysgonomonas sp. Marseille-P4361 TaxID=2161820 RepID=UPI000D56094A|nr:methyltransferase [Dysgonomonas sp. Marseille-P4361]